MPRSRPSRPLIAIALACVAALVSGCAATAGSTPQLRSGRPAPQVRDRASARAHALAEAAMWQVGKTVRYDAAYVQLKYPGGDVPLDRGACTDVVVRAFRQLGTDLQVTVHEDMTRAFRRYPQSWGLPGPDANIDHRRVPNLQTYFTRTGKAVPVTRDAADYQPGDLVTWDVWGRPHIGVVATRRSADGRRFCIAHNIGSGVQVSDDLFTYRITGHYRPY